MLGHGDVDSSPVESLACRFPVGSLSPRVSRMLPLNWESAALPLDQAVH